MRRSVKTGLYGLVIAGVVGGSAAWAHSPAQKTIALRIDGSNQQVHTSASKVSGALSAAGIQVGSHDIVAPDLNSAIADHGTIVVRRGHLLHLTVDGVNRDVWVNADSVSEALGQLGYSPASLVSVSRSMRLDRGATTLSIDSPKQVTFLLDGKRMVVRSAGPTVRDAISASLIFLGPHDRVSVPATSQLRDNEVIRISRLKYATSSETLSVPYSTVKQSDSNAYVGTSTVVTAGKPGAKRVTYRLVYVDGKLAGKIAVSTAMLSQPVSQVVKTGSKQQPQPQPQPTQSAVARRRDPAAEQQRPELGRRRAVRVRRQLAHQHRQRLLRRPAVRLRHLAFQRRWRVRPARGPGHPGTADRRREPALRGPGLQPLAGLRAAVVGCSTVGVAPCAGTAEFR